MRYKLVAIDLDDTLLADDLKISPQTIKAIQESVKKGVIVTLATGRMYQSAVKYAKQIELNVPIITYQGAYVKNVLDDEVLYQRFLPSDIAIDIIKKLKVKNKVIQVYLNDELYVEAEHEYIINYSKASGVNYHIVDDLIELINQSKEDPIKVLTIDEPKEIKKMLEEFNQIFQKEINITISKPFFLEFTHKEATKGQAIKYLANLKGINLEEVIAIGDSYNDKDMIEIAGLGVAMSNGNPDIKKIADYVTKTNNDHGVWEVLQKFILKEELSDERR
ncbi:hypothetical protein BHF71_06215 [Vulcanibacillus modesticaldus]|uniref:Hydrolase n=1 Tax=Vulcanibacillus modesticaldus TaxID=337097 RepID=A0A1D2YWX5_9BACI|nr:Cof-type HAD-IIB family hydrolase [Vulcanibacillus modesticaldus]OEG00117.1 hypothetical protein BHF71_06215 [Vulcanibacillus modesticaldus]